jgi:hypothetical protein
MKNWEKMEKYMALYYPTPCSNPFGSEFPHLHLLYLYSNVFIVVKNFHWQYRCYFNEKSQNGLEVLEVFDGISNKNFVANCISYFVGYI